MNIVYQEKTFGYEPRDLVDVKLRVTVNMPFMVLNSLGSWWDGSRVISGVLIETGLVGDNVAVVGRDGAIVPAWFFFTGSIYKGDPVTVSMPGFLKPAGVGETFIGYAQKTVISTGFNLALIPIQLKFGKA